MYERFLAKRRFREQGVGSSNLPAPTKTAALSGLVIGSTHVGEIDRPVEKRVSEGHVPQTGAGGSPLAQRLLSYEHRIRRRLAPSWDGEGESTRSCGALSPRSDVLERDCGAHGRRADAHRRRCWHPNPSLVAHPADLLIFLGSALVTFFPVVLATSIGLLAWEHEN
jgi:hypothetical protein